MLQQTQWDTHRTHLDYCQWGLTLPEDTIGHNIVADIS